MAAIPTDRILGAVSGGSIAAGRFGFPTNARISIWGQSNALGRANGTDISLSPLSNDIGLGTFWTGVFDRVYIWNGSAYAKLSSANNKCTTGQFGPEFTIAVRWMRETTSGNLYIEKEAFSGVSITYFDPVGTNYPQMVSRRNAANTWLSIAGISLVDAGFVWIQGETDYLQTQSWYQTRLESLLLARISDGLELQNTKRLLMQMATGSANYSSNIAAAKTAISEANPLNTLAPPMMYYMKVDNLHQNGQGQVQAGYDAFEYIFNKSHIST